MHLDQNEMMLLHGRVDQEGKREIVNILTRPFYADQRTSIAKAGKELDLKRFKRTAVLKPGEYQMLLIEAPKVGSEEIKWAVRWQVKDLLDHPAEDVTLDVLDIPVLTEDSLAGHYMYVIASPNAVIASHMTPYEFARIPLDAIEIPETAQRNVSTLYEQPGEGAVVLHLGEQSALLTITYRSDLYMARRMDAPLTELTAGTPAERDEARSRLTVELQRSLDHFERQYRSVQINRLWIAPEPAPTGLAGHLQNQLGIPVAHINFSDVLVMPDEGLDQTMQWKLFHAIGASLREETAT